MYVVPANNVNDALWELMLLINTLGVRRPSRAGDVLEIPAPVTASYNSSRERVLFSPERDANPFFHLMEALWMLAGRDDLETVEYYNRRMRSFSDDGIRLHGAYGKRWRSWFDMDQLNVVVGLLRKHPDSRRGIIQMWDPRRDLFTDEFQLDVPCNTTIAVRLSAPPERTLELTVFCRSNDLIWGMVGANSVHFSILQEYLAARLNVPVGTMYQIANNLHAYENIFTELKDTGYLTEPPIDRYVNGDLVPMQLVDEPSSFNYELSLFLSGTPASLRDHVWENKFFGRVAVPMKAAYDFFRKKDDGTKYDDMLAALEEPDDDIKADWLQAAREWTLRRKGAFLARG